MKGSKPEAATAGWGLFRALQAHESAHSARHTCVIQLQHRPHASDLAIEHPIGAGSSAREKDRWVAELAKQQHGVVARVQLLGLGLSRRAIGLRVERGLLHEVFFGVYVFGARRISKKGRWMAAVLASGEGAVLSHRSAARVWRLLPPGAEVIEVTCPPGRVVRRKGIVSR